MVKLLISIACGAQNLFISEKAFALLSWTTAQKAILWLSRVQFFLVVVADLYCGKIVFLPYANLEVAVLKLDTKGWNRYPVQMVECVRY